MSGLDERISAKNKALFGTVPPFFDLEIPIDWVTGLIYCCLNGMMSLNTSIPSFIWINTNDSLNLRPVQLFKG